jgi:preprotein translocase subunit YajC
MPRPSDAFAFHPWQDPQPGRTPAVAEGGEAQAQVPDTPGGPKGGPPPACGNETFLWMGLFLVLMWLLVFRPASKQRKEHLKLVQSLKKGDRAVTSGGIHGEVAGLTDKTVTLRIDTIRMVVDRSAIARVERGDASKEDRGGDGKA